ncbi:MAG: DUF5335 family protein [Gemmatimonadota bacterium]
MTTQIPEHDWAHELQNFTNRNAGRKTVIEELAESLGAQEEERGGLLRGVAYDRRDHRIAIMVGDIEGTDRHLTHTVSADSIIELLTDPRGRDSALRIQRPDGQTILRFD